MSVHLLLRFLHFVGLIVLAAGLIGIFIAELRIRRASGLGTVEEALHTQTIHGFFLIYPGAFTVGGTGVALVLWLGLGFFDHAWLTGMWCSTASRSSRAHTHSKARAQRAL